MATAALLGQQIEVCYGSTEGMLSDRLANPKFTAPADETPLAYMRYDGPLWVHIVLNSGNVGGTSLSMTIDANTVQFTKSKPGRNAVLMDFDNSAECIANVTNVGGTGGLGPVAVQLVNALPTY